MYHLFGTELLATSGSTANQYNFSDHPSLGLPTSGSTTRASLSTGSE